MTKQDDKLFEPRVAAWLEQDPDRAPAIVLQTVVAALPSIPQRRRPLLRGLGAAPRLVSFGALAAAVALMVVGVTVLQPLGSGQQPTPSPSPIASLAPSPVPSPTPIGSPKPFVRPAEAGGPVPETVLGSWYVQGLSAFAWVLPAGDPTCTGLVSTAQDCSIWSVAGGDGTIAYQTIMTEVDGELAIKWIGGSCANTASRYTYAITGDALTLGWVSGGCQSGDFTFVRPGTNAAPSAPPQPNPS